MKRQYLGAVALLAAGLAAPGCAQGAESEGDLQFPDRATFPAVAGALDRRCATLDCHGTPERNLRLYGRSGLRIDPADVPGSGDTTEAEHDASYESIVGLEPEVMSLVVSERGRAPERLTLIRKARGSEAHKGGARIALGDDSDVCLTSWLGSALEEEACAFAADIPPPW
jgi:hypothetical protein